MHYNQSLVSPRAYILTIYSLLVLSIACGVSNSLTMSRPASKQTFYFLRHGITETNEFMHKIPWGSDGFYDPGFYDTRLSSAGIKQCQALHQTLRASKNSNIVFSTNLVANGNTKASLQAQAQGSAHNSPTTSRSLQLAFDLDDIDLLLVSPLTRTLQTATYALQHEEDVLPSSVPKISHPLLAERVYLSADTGRSKELLMQEFPHFDHHHLPATDWWYKHHQDMVYNVHNHNHSHAHTGPSNSHVQHIHTHFATPSPPFPHPYEEWRPSATQPYPTPGEPTAFFRSRMTRARQYLLALPYSKVLVVSHWGVIRALTGKDARNCEVVGVMGEELLQEPFVD